MVARESSILDPTMLWQSTGARAARWRRTALTAGGLLALATAWLCPRPLLAQGPQPAQGRGDARRIDSPRLTAGPGVVLVPPIADPGSRLRIEALTVDPDVDRVVFYLDGHESGVDDRRPFRLTLKPAELPEPTKLPASVRAVAFARDGTVLGEDALDWSAVTGARRPFQLAIAGIDRTAAAQPMRGAGGATALRVRTRLTVPEGASLDRLEIYFDRRLAAVLDAPPFETTIGVPGLGPDDFVRVVAHLADGRTLEDAAPVLSATGADRLQICLVDLFAFVADRWGEPIRGLGPADFRVRLDGRPLPVQRFHEAAEVPLALGLLIDSSESMAPIMDETKEAARRFLDRTLVPGDQAFLVDVGTVPRVVREMTGSAAELADGFSELEAGGTTALYDAILLGLLRLERHPGRRALVVLSDGRDVGSDFGPTRCLEEAERAGVPIYVLSLAGLPGRRTNPERNFRLEAMARRTGGRVLPVSTLNGLDRAYAEIDRELRSQYVLGLGSDRVLSDRELADLAVEVDRPGARVRTAATRQPESP